MLKVSQPLVKAAMLWVGVVPVGSQIWSDIASFRGRQVGAMTEQCSVSNAAFTV